MFEPIFIEDEGLLIHSFGPEQIKSFASIAADVYDILSDEDTLRFLPEKRLHSVEEAEAYLKGNLLRFHAGSNFLHFITDRPSGKVIGLIDVISPDMARTHYHLDHYPHFIEFYLKGDLGRRQVMTRLLPLFVGKLGAQQINQLGAVVNRANVGARKVLTKTGFSYFSRFDGLQDFYITSSNS